MAQRIPITQGNDFEVRLRPILMDGTIVDASLLTDRVVKVKHGTTETTYTSTVDEDYICIAFDSTLQLGDYSVKITAKLGDQDVAANYGNLFSIVPFGMATPIVPVKGDLVIIGVSDDETEAYRQALEDAKDNYNTAAEALEDAKEELEEQAEALTDIAKESTLNNPTYGLQAIKTAIGNIPGGGGGGGGVSKAEVQEMLDDQTDTLEDDIDDVLTAATAAKTAAEAIVIPTDYAKAADIPTDYAKSSDIPTDYAKQSNVVAIAQELDKIGSPAEGQPTTLFAAIAAGGSGGGGSEEIMSKLTDIENYIQSQSNIEGYYVSNGVELSCVGDLIENWGYISEIVDNKKTSLSISGGFFRAKKVTLNKVVNCTTQRPFGSSSTTEYLSLPLLKETNSYGFIGMSALKEARFASLEKLQDCDFYNIPNLQTLYVPKLKSTVRTYFYNCVNLIDITTGANFNASISLAMWNPTNALSSTSISLIAEGETFANNLEKLLYNIREHFAANLPDLTGLSSLTITFSAAVKAAINADATTAAAFTNKNWTIA